MKVVILFAFLALVGGVDRSSGIILKFSNQRLAILSNHTTLDTGCPAGVYGTKGKIEIKSEFWCATEVIVNGKSYQFPMPESPIPPIYPKSESLSYEAQEIRECLLKGEKECATVSHKYSLQVAAIIDECKRQIGLSYGCE